MMIRATIAAEYVVDSSAALYRATCQCGWVSPYFSTAVGVDSATNDHIGQVHS